MSANDGDRRSARSPTIEILAQLLEPGVLLAPVQRRAVDVADFDFDLTAVAECFERGLTSVAGTHAHRLELFRAEIDVQIELARDVALRAVGR